MISTAVILAAGAGTRLGALGRRYSKAMVPLAGRPLIAWVVERLRAAGLSRFVVVAHVSDGGLQRYAEANGFEVTTQAARRGIADALVCAAPQLRADAMFLACACDSLFAVADVRRLLQVAAAHPHDATIAVQTVPPDATAARSAVVRDGEFVRAIVEKPPPGSAPSNVISLPLYVLTHRLLNAAATTAPLRGERYLSSTLADDIRAGGVVRCVEFGGRLEVTTADDVARAETALAAESNQPA
jgi:bifunctional UDP-N-acetylglucosamine pyrophosphorylase/glucosamine-1-phosphate N-acetyltransferase